MAAKDHIAKFEALWSIILTNISNAPRYVRNNELIKDLEMPTIAEEIAQEEDINPD